MKKYTAAERKIIHNHLVKAKSWLWDGLDKRNGKEEYICIAVKHANYGYVKYSASIRMVADMIQDRLGMHDGFTLDVEGYLDYILKIDYKLLTNKNMQAYRHRWLDSLIKEFS
jgi:hypothetical protein